MAEVSVNENLDKKDFKDNYTAAITALEDIRDNALTFNNAQALQALRTFAIILLRLLKGLKWIFRIS